MIEDYFYLLIILGLNYCFAFMLTIELGSFELLERSTKVLWLIFIWLIPILGPLIMHRYLKIGWAKGRNSGGNDIQPPSDGI